MSNKKKFRGFLMALLAMMTCGVAAACSKDSSKPSESSSAPNTSESTSENPSESTPSESVPTEESYTVKFVDEDGQVLQSGVVKEGELPVYAGETPVKAATAEYTYTFAGWDKEVVEATEDVTYTVKFDAVKNKYTVTFKNYDGTVLQTVEGVEYGVKAVYPDGAALPEKEGNNEFSYVFAGWDKVLAEVTGNVEYTAVFDEVENTYTIKFLNEDESVIAEKSDYHYGDTITAPTPEKEEDETYTYQFEGWKLQGTEDIVAVDGTVAQDRVYVAVFTATEKVKAFDVEFYNGDEICYLAEQVPVGELPVYAGEPLTKYGLGVWEFDGWDKEIAPVQGAGEAYHAKFKKLYGYKIVSVVDGQPTDASADYWGGFDAALGMPNASIQAATTYRFTVEDIDYTQYDSVTLPIAVNYVGMKVSIGGVSVVTSTPKAVVMNITVLKDGTVYYNNERISGVKMADGVISFDVTRNAGDTYAALNYGALAFDTFVVPETKEYTTIADKAAAANANFTFTDVTATNAPANGFEKSTQVTVASWTNGTASSVDLTQYSEVKFAIKTGDSSKFYSIVNDGTTIGTTEWGNNNTEWLIVSLVKNGEAWDMYFDGALQKEGLTIANDNLSGLNLQFTAATYYVSEIKGVAVPGAIKEYITVADKAAAANANFTFTDVTATNAPALGFEKSTQVTVASWTNGTALSVDLTQYSEVKFAIKTGDSSKFYSIVNDGTTIGTTQWGNNNTEWLVVSLVKNGETWDMYFDGALQKAGLTIASDNLNGLNLQFAEATYYVSEIKGVKIEKNYVNVKDQIVAPTGTTTVADASDEADKQLGIAKITTTAHNSWQFAKLSDTDLSAYTQVRFFVKTDLSGGMLCPAASGDYNDRAYDLSANQWVEFVLTKNAEGKFDVEVFGATKAKGYSAVSNLNEIAICVGDFKSTSYNLYVSNLISVAE